MKRWLYRLVGPAAGRRLLLLAALLYGVMAAAGVAGHGVFLLAGPPAGGDAAAAPAILIPFLAFDRWIRSGWQVRFLAILGLNLFLCVGAGLLTMRWRPAGWLFLGVFGAVLALGSFTTGCVGLFVAFLPTLVPETLAVLLCVSAGFNLHARRRAAGGVGLWLVPSDAWLLLAVLLCLIPAGLYEAYFIATFLPIP